LAFVEIYIFSVLSKSHVIFFVKLTGNILL